MSKKKIPNKAKITTPALVSTSEMAEGLSVSELAAKGGSALNVMKGVAKPDSPAKRRPMPRKRGLSVERHIQGVLGRDRSVVGQTITLMESSAPAHRPKARAVLEGLLAHTGRAVRIGITGVPGAGKSTLIETIGTRLTASGRRVAVLAVDPSSSLSGGSILGDKTRMEELAGDPNALVRPSPCGGWLGGVARGTREAMLVCEAAGYDTILVETVGVGQSETQVASMVDTFLLLSLAGAGDKLQGIKRGILEMADVVTINKADGSNLSRAKVARAELAGALMMLRPATEGWTPPVLTCSAQTGDGVDTLLESLEHHFNHLEETDQLESKRRQQAVFWMEQTLEQMLKDRFRAHPAVSEKWNEIRAAVKMGDLPPTAAAERLIDLSSKPSE